MLYYGHYTFFTSKQRPISNPFSFIERCVILTRKYTIFARSCNAQLTFVPAMAEIADDMLHVVVEGYDGIPD